jgi:hypothetical protein
MKNLIILFLLPLSLSAQLTVNNTSHTPAALIEDIRPLQGKLVINNLIVNNLSLKNFLFSIFFHTFEYEKGTKYRFCGFYG